MRLPHFRIRTLMIAVAALAVTLPLVVELARGLLAYRYSQMSMRYSRNAEQWGRYASNRLQSGKRKEARRALNIRQRWSEKARQYRAAAENP